MTEGLALISTIAGALLKLAALLCILVALPWMWGLRRWTQRMHALATRLQVDLAPLIAHTTSIADNVNYVTRSIRADVAQVNATITEGNARMRDAIAATERRLQDFNALLEVVQEEAEQLFVSSAAAVRAVRSGAAALGGHGTRDTNSGAGESGSRGRRGPEFAVDGVDGTELEDGENADDTDDLEMADGYDRSTQPTEDRDTARPRVGPRTRRHG